MRVFRLVVLALLCYVVAMVALFPAAPIVDRIRPQLGPVALEGVSGKLFSGRVERVASTDDLLPLEASNVRWRLAPLSLLKGGGAHVELDAYGGTTTAFVLRRWNGDIEVSDIELRARAKTLEPLLPAPIAAFDGALAADVATVLLEDQLLKQVDGQITWSEAALERPLAAQFGTIRIDVSPNSDGTHAGNMSASGGDIDGDGSFTLAPNGDFTLDALLTPAPTAPAELVNSLKSVVQPDASGRYRVQRSGNVNRLL